MSPEELFRKGLSALHAGRAAEAVDHFRAAIATEKQHGVLRPQMRYVSYYGLGLALSDRPTRAAVEFCEKAAARDSFDPVLQLNLGRVYLLAGRTIKAIQTFERGLEMDPGNRRLRAELNRIDRRGAPVLASLHRDHPLNRSLGRLRAALPFRRPRSQRG